MFAARIRADGQVIERFPEGRERAFPDTPLRPLAAAEVEAAADARLIVCPGFFGIFPPYFLRCYYSLPKKNGGTFRPSPSLPLALIGFRWRFCSGIFVPLSECCGRFCGIEFAPYTEPSCQVVTETSPCGFHRCLQPPPAPKLPKSTPLLDPGMRELGDLRPSGIDFFCSLCCHLGLESRRCLRLLDPCNGSTPLRRRVF